MPPTEYALRQDLVKTGRLMYEKGFIGGSDGNISARLGRDRLLITPSGLPKGMLAPEQLLVVDQEGRPAGRPSSLRPTSELPMHLAVYRRRPDVQAVVHAHPPTTIALSIAGISLSECILPETIVFLGLIPTTAYATPSSKENVRAIDALIDHHDAIVLRRHGTLTVGDDPLQAFMRLETVEQNARIAFMLAQLGVSNPLAPTEVRKLLRMRQQMGLARSDESTAFCEACGVCHDGDSHPDTLRPDASRALPGAVDVEEVRRQVAAVVRRLTAETETSKRKQGTGNY